MTIRRHEVIVVDIESTCWESHPPPSQRSEIIEIGICAFDLKKREPSNKCSILIKPTMSKVSEFCTQLTSITPDMVGDGIGFLEACAILEDAYTTQERLWLSWGNYDKRMFTEQCQIMGLPYPFSEKHCNLKNRFAKYEGKRMGMASALKQRGLDLIGTHHRGDDDAWNIARLLGSLIDEYGDDVLASAW